MEAAFLIDKSSSAVKEMGDAWCLCCPSIGEFFGTLKANLPISSERIDGLCMSLSGFLWGKVRLEAKLPLLLLWFHSSLWQSAQFTGVSAEEAAHKLSSLLLPCQFGTMNLKSLALFSLPCWNHRHCKLKVTETLQVESHLEAIWWFLSSRGRRSLFCPSTASVVQPTHMCWTTAACGLSRQDRPHNPMVKQPLQLPCSSPRPVTRPSWEPHGVMLFPFKHEVIQKLEGSMLPF